MALTSGRQRLTNWKRGQGADRFFSGWGVGAPTLDVWVVRKDFAEQHPEIVKAFAKSAIDAQQPYIANPEAWLKQPDNISKLARLSGVPEADVPGW